MKKIVNWFGSLSLFWKIAIFILIVAFYFIGDNIDAKRIDAIYLSNNGTIR